MKNGCITDLQHSLMMIIVNRGKGSKVLQLAMNLGLCNTCCFLGKGTVRNSTLQLMEMGDVSKEIIFTVVSSKEEEEVINKFSDKFHFEKQNHGIAFTIPLAGVMNMNNDNSVIWDDDLPEEDNGYYVMLVIVDKGNGEKVIELTQEAGYYGGTIIKARGSANDLKMTLDMHVEPEKEAVLMLTESGRVKNLAFLVTSAFRLEEENTGIMALFKVGRTAGLYKAEQEAGL